MSQALDDLTVAVVALETAVANRPAPVPSDGATAAELQPLTDRITAATATLSAPAG